MAAKDGVQGRRRLRIFAAAVALVLLCAVCVGGVSGEVKVSTEQGLRDEVLKGTETIIITADIALENPNPIVIESGKKITIKSDGEFRTIYRDKDYPIEERNRVSYFAPIFSVSEGGDLIIGESGSGTLRLHGGRNPNGLFDIGKAIVKPGGGAVYVDGGSFTMNEGATITKFGLLGTDLAGNGAVYVESGKFTMNGGSITASVSMKGSGVYVGSGATFEINGGKITENGHNEYIIVDQTYGGGVYVETNGILITSTNNSFSDFISGNKGSPQYVYNELGLVEYTIHHVFYDIDGESVVNEIKQTESGEISSDTSAKALSVHGYKPDAFEQKKITADGTVVTINYHVSNTYNIVIPSNLVIKEDTTGKKRGTLPVALDNLWILDNFKVVVSVDSKYDFHLAYETDQSDTSGWVLYELYELMDDDTTTIIKDGVPLIGEFTMEKNIPISIIAELKGNPPYKGTYVDTLTFVFNCIESTNVQN